MWKAAPCTVPYTLGIYRDTGKESRNRYSILGLYRDTGKENGNHYSILGLFQGLGLRIVDGDSAS